MPKWTASNLWEGEDAYVVGGGTSLDTFDWSLLAGKHAVGCNSAFVKHAALEFVVFADQMWWTNIGAARLPEYGGCVVACCPYLDTEVRDVPWVLRMERYDPPGLSDDPTRLGFNANSGSLALNLALLLGARRVFMLGFDMRHGPGGRVNWHDLRYEKSSVESYGIFRKGFRHAAADLPRKFPGREVWNVTDDSGMEAFPKVSLAEHFSKKGAESNA